MVGGPGPLTLTRTANIVVTPGPPDDTTPVTSPIAFYTIRGPLVHPGVTSKIYIYDVMCYDGRLATLDRPGDTERAAPGVRVNVEPGEPVTEGSPDIRDDVGGPNHTLYTDFPLIGTPVTTPDKVTT